MRSRYLLACLGLVIGLVGAACSDGDGASSGEGNPSRAQLAYVDRSSLGAACESSSQCTAGACVLYLFGEGDAEGHCTSKPDCSALQCQEGTECSLTGSEPGQLACAVSNGGGPAGESSPPVKDAGTGG